MCYSTSNTEYWTCLMAIFNFDHDDEDGELDERRIRFCWCCILMLILTLSQLSCCKNWTFCSSNYLESLQSKPCENWIELVNVYMIEFFQFFLTENILRLWLEDNCYYNINLDICYGLVQMTADIITIYNHKKWVEVKKEKF